MESNFRASARDEVIMVCSSLIVFAAIRGVLGHCTPLHPEAGISWFHVALWTGLVLAVVALAAVAWVCGSPRRDQYSAEGGVDDRRTQ
jgi:hypothetical protein